MNIVQMQVEGFMAHMGQLGERHVAFRDVELRKKLMQEELAELVDAIDTEDMVAAADAICDLLYVVYGTAVAFGIDVQPMMNRVHAANMEKAGGPKDEHGKQLKPDGWKPPDIRRELELQGWHNNTEMD